MTNRCEVHPDCEDPAVAQVGHVWVCLRGYNAFMEGEDVEPVVKEDDDE